MSAPHSGNSTESNALWHHSLTSAMAAEVVVNSGLDLSVEAPVAFTAGLLHDIGKLVVTQFLDADKQSAILGYISMNGVPRVEAERAILGTDHAEVGAWLLKSWNLPEDIVEAVANHHRPVLEPRPQLSVVAHLANCTAHLANSAPGCESSAVRVNSDVMEQLGITPDLLGRLVVEVRDSSESVGRFMAMA
jgi:putative nucleotidyltransferase with HDIG domain